MTPDTTIVGEYNHTVTICCSKGVFQQIKRMTKARMYAAHATLESCKIKYFVYICRKL